MKADERVMVVCNEAGVEVKSGTMFLVATMQVVYNAMKKIGEVFVNLFE